MKMRKILVFILISISVGIAQAQELNCTVMVNSDRIQTSNYDIFKDMEQAIWEFMNNQRWTNDAFGADEKVECTFFITITSMPILGTFGATMQIQSSRTIYGTDYESPLFNYVDKDMIFEYQQDQPFYFQKNSFTDNLTSILAFYAYIVLGYDYDSFSNFGGKEMFEKANTIVQNAQQTPEPGWKAFDGDRNRYWLIQDLINPQFDPMREGIYKYHRLAFDTFEKNPDNARKIILEVLRDFKKVYALKPTSMLFRAFFESKANEISNLFSQAQAMQKQQVFNIVTELDATNSDKYQRMIKGGR